jgi:methylenetetrahydrofolate dehydrogenase (NADP+)/methenyltetrahydrofolate cyclohydrolase
MLRQKAIVVDAGTASENGTIVGDVDMTVRETRTDLTITPIKGGVGPLTIAVLFDHIIQACLKRAGKL